MQEDIFPSEWICHGLYIKLVSGWQYMYVSVSMSVNAEYTANHIVTG